MYIYLSICDHENNVPSRLSPQWLCGNSCTWAHDVHDVYEPYIYIYIFLSYYLHKKKIEPKNMQQYPTG